MERRTYPNGTTPLVDIESEGVEWLDWCGALYESSKADYEYCDNSWSTSASDYSATAHGLAEDIEYTLYESAMKIAEEW